MSAFDPIDTYVHLTDGPEARPIEVASDFWAKIHEREDLQDGRLVCAFRFDADWSTWERHPAGDEIVCLIEGALDLVLETDDGEQVIPMRDRGLTVVPRGVWHTARVRTPCVGLFITRGGGTEVRPV